METTINRITPSDINFALIQDTITKIDSFVAANDYQMKDRKGLDNINETVFKEAINNLSMKRRKKFAQYISYVQSKPSLGMINKFLHFLFTKIMQSDLRVRVTKSEKELAIQDKRKAYKDALAIAKKAYADYKTEKGDFYKLKLAKGQLK